MRRRRGDSPTRGEVTETVEKHKEEMQEKMDERIFFAFLGNWLLDECRERIEDGSSLADSPLPYIGCYNLYENIRFSLFVYLEYRDIKETFNSLSSCFFSLSSFSLECPLEIIHRKNQ